MYLIVYRMITLQYMPRLGCCSFQINIFWFFLCVEGRMVLKTQGKRTVRGPCPDARCHWNLSKGTPPKVPLRDRAFLGDSWGIMGVNKPLIRPSWGGRWQLWGILRFALCCTVLEHWFGHSKGSHTFQRAAKVKQLLLVHLFGCERHWLRSRSATGSGEL